MEEWAVWGYKTSDMYPNAVGVLERGFRSKDEAQAACATGKYRGMDIGCIRTFGMRTKDEPEE